MNEMSGIMPTYDINGNNGNWGYGGGIWVILLFALMCGGFGGWNRGYGNGAGVAALNGVTNEFLYTNLNGTIDRGFTQTANQNFGIQKDIWQTKSDIAMQLANNGFNSKECCCEINRNIDSVKFEDAKNTCAITTAITAGNQKILDKLCDMERNALVNENSNLKTALTQANNQLSQMAQTVNLIERLRPTPIPAFNVNNPFANSYGTPCGYAA